MDFMKKSKTVATETKTTNLEKGKAPNEKNKDSDKEFDLNIEKILENWEVFNLIKEVPLFKRKER